MFDQIRHAFRSLRREPSFTLPAISTLALGIGATVAVFSLVEAVLLRPLPYRGSDEIVTLRHRDLRTGLTKSNVGGTDMIDVANRQKSFAAFAPLNTVTTTLYGYGSPIDLRGISAGADFAAVTGIEPRYGRGITTDDTRPGAPPVMLIGFDVWNDTFHADPSVIGSTVAVGTGRRQIVGVLPPGFSYPPTRRVDALLPMVAPAVAPVQRGGWILATARLKPGVTLESATSELQAISSQLGVEYPSSNKGTQYYAVSLRESLIGDTRKPLLLLFGAVGVVLLITCVNVSNLLVVRAISRRGELALRLALGASRWRLMTQVLIENLVLSAIAAGAGLLIAYWGTSALVALVPTSVAVPALATAGVNATVLAFAVGITILVGLVFSVVIALHANNSDASGALVSRTRTTMSRATRQTTSMMVIVEVALAVVLLVGAGLVLRSFQSLLSVQPGFDRSGVTTVGMQLPAASYATPESRRAFYPRLFAALKSRPAISAVGAAEVTPLTGNNWTVPFIRADRPLAPGQRAPDIGWQLASRGYFESLAIPLRAGRLFDDRDATGSNTVIISEAVARRFFQNESAVGQRVSLGDEQAEIVGVVGDVRRAGLTDNLREDMYFPFEHSPGAGTTLFVRGHNGVNVSYTDLRSVIQTLEPNARVLPARTLDDIAAESGGATRLTMWLLGCFGAIALVLAAVGVYGVMSYAVRQRWREFGTRLALGAQGGDILWLAMRQGVVVVGLGLAAGIAAALAASRLLDAMLFNVTAHDPATMATASLLLTVALIVGCYVPARRAARINPARALGD